MHNDDYEVGYKKPPEKTRFQKGQSGNPKGRPTGSKSLETLFMDELQRQVTIKEGGNSRVISKLEAMVKQIVNKAAQGDARAQDRAIRMYNDLTYAKDANSQNDEMHEDDLKVIANLKLRTSTGEKS